jgi:DnaJ family protein A protein 2
VIAGDIILVLHQKEHPVFRRDGDDLHMNYELSLYLRQHLLLYLYAYL